MSQSIKSQSRLSNAKDSTHEHTETRTLKCVSSICSQQSISIVAANGELMPRLGDLLLDKSWLEALPGELQKPYFVNLEKFVGQEVSGKVPIYPPQASIFRAFNTCPFDRVKVVILGQVRGLHRYKVLPTLGATELKVKSMMSMKLGSSQVYQPLT
jgi:hypothetical protein